MRHRFLPPLVFIFMFEVIPSGAVDLMAQDFSSRDTVQGYKYNFSQFGNETWSFVKQPTRWDGNDWLKIGLVSAGTFLAMQADQPIRDAVIRDNRYAMTVPIEFGRVWGELYMPVLLFSGFAAHSLLADDMGTRKIAYEIGQASIYAAVTVQLLKLSIGRARPYMNSGSNDFHPFTSFSFRLDYQSLPGGHNVVAFVLSTVLSRNAKPVWLKIVAYVPAALTFVSRVYQDKHWTSDDFLGAALGYFIADWVVDLHEQRDSRVNVTSLFPLTISVALN